MSNDEMLRTAKKVVVDYWNQHPDRKDAVFIAEDDVFIVWFCKTLQNWKALVSTVLNDGMFYEITYNGDKHEVYLDAYKKKENVRFVGKASLETRGSEFEMCSLRP